MSVGAMSWEPRSTDGDVGREHKLIERVALAIEALTTNEALDRARAFGLWAEECRPGARADWPPTSGYSEPAR